MPDKKIEDYLHLYLGGELKHIGGGTMIMNSLVLDNMLINKYEKDEYKPILRPLSDACMQEKSDAKSLIRIDKLGQQRVESMAEVTKYLLSKHFDLFGLIEAGLAIDKTTIK